MRAFWLAIGLLAVLVPAATVPARGADLTRDQYIDQAKRRAEKRFDKMDTDHNGVLTIEERRAARAARGSKKGGAAPAAE
jgi:hypothetical protein